MAAALDNVLHKGKVSKIYNNDTQQARTVISVASDICKHCGLAPTQCLSRTGHSTTTELACVTADPLWRCWCLATLSAAPIPACVLMCFDYRHYFICGKKLLSLGWREERQSCLVLRLN